MKIFRAIGLVFIDIISCFTITQAQPTSSLKVASDPPTPPDSGTPDKRKPSNKSWSLRGNRETAYSVITSTESGFSGYTLSEHPTFWFYVPYKTSSVSSGQFSLEDIEGNPFYQTSFHLPNTPGFVSVSIPITEKSLEKNKLYNWTFTLSCASKDSEQPNVVFHRGVVQRVDRADIKTQLNSASVRNIVNLYLENSIWYDAPKDLVEIRKVRQAWLDLFKAMNLEQLEQEPIAGSVVPIEQ
jgi:hypothetical protein